MRGFGQHPIFIFGAGATRACGGPLTADILPNAFKEPVYGRLECTALAESVNRCLIEHFHVPFGVAEDSRGLDARLSYSCDIQTQAYRERRTEYGQLLKLHGSLNWLYCACCRRLDIGMSDSGRKAVTCKVLNELYNANHAT